MGILEDVMLDPRFIDTTPEKQSEVLDKIKTDNLGGVELPEEEMQKYEIGFNEKVAELSNYTANMDKESPTMDDLQKINPEFYNKGMQDKTVAEQDIKSINKKYSDKLETKKETLAKITKYIPKFKTDLILGASKNITEYTASIAKLLGNSELQFEANMLGKAIDETSSNEYVKMAGQMILDPINLTPMGIFNKGSKASRVLKSTGAGAIVGASTMAAKNYGNQSSTQEEKNTEVAIGAGLVATINGIIALVTKGKVTNAIKNTEDIATLEKTPEKFGLNTNDVQNITEEIKQTDTVFDAEKYLNESMSPKLTENLQNVAKEQNQEQIITPQKTELEQTTQVVKDIISPEIKQITMAERVQQKIAKKTKEIERVQPKQTEEIINTEVTQKPKQIEPIRSDKLNTLDELKTHPRYQELIDMRRNRSAKEGIYRQNLVSKRQIYENNYGKGWERDVVPASYERNNNYDFALTKQDIKKVDNGKVDDVVLDKIKNDLGLLENDPLWSKQVDSKMDYKSRSSYKSFDEWADAQVKTIEEDYPDPTKMPPPKGTSQKDWDELNTMFNKGIDNVVAGTVAGIEQDENGKITINPTKFILGLGGYTIVKKALKNKQVKGVLKEYAQKAIDTVDMNPAVQKENGLNAMFVGAKAGDKGAFSDVASKQAMKEIGDSKAIYNGKDFKTLDGDKDVSETTVGFVLKHDELYKKYPQIKDIKLVFDKNKKGASFETVKINDKTEDAVITMGGNIADKDAKSVLLHELQHSIQDIEKWAKGGSSKQLAEEVPKEVGEVQAVLQDAITKKNSDDWVWNTSTLEDIINSDKTLSKEVRDWANNIAQAGDKEINSFLKNTPHSKYLRLYGEQQARATQYRMDMTPEQRANETWQDTLKRIEGEYKEPIVRFNGDIAESASKPIKPKEIKTNKASSIKINASPSISGGIIGGVSGTKVDYNQDGKQDYKDIAIGALGGALGAKVIKSDFVANKAQKALKAIIDSDIYKRVEGSETLDKALGHKIYQKKDYMAIREASISQTNAQSEKYLMLHKQLKLLEDTDRKKIHDYMSGDESIKLSEQQKILADGYIEYIDGLGKKLVGLKILKKEQYLKFKGKYLKRSYSKHLGDKKASSGGGKTIDKVYARGNVWIGSKADLDNYKTPDLVTQKAQLGKFEDGLIEFTKLKNGQYRFRQDWTKEQRERWGEITDIAYTLPDTLQRLENMVNMANMLKSTSKTKYVFEEEVPNSVLLGGDRYGELKGKYVTSDVANDIDEFNQAVFGKDTSGQLLSEKGMELFYSLSTFWKKSHTVYNPIAHANNLLSNITMQFMEGINPAQAVINAQRGAFASRKLATMRDLVAKKLIGLTADEVKTLELLGKDDDVKLYLQAESLGLFGRSKLKDIMQEYVSTAPKVKTGIMDKTDSFLSKTYEGEDNIMRFSLLKGVMSKDKDLSLFQAVRKVNNIIPDYSKPMSKWAKFGRKSMLTPFISWTYYTTPIVLRQIKDNPERLAVLAGVMYGMNKLAGVDAYNEEDIPQKNFSMKRIPIFVDGDEITTMKVDRWIPHGEMLSPVDFVSNLTNGGAWKTIPELLSNQNYYFGSKITRREGGEKAYDLAKYAIQSITPDIIDNLWNFAESKILSKEDRRKHRVTQPRTTKEEMLKMVGLNVMTYNKKEQKEKTQRGKIKKAKKPLKDILEKSKSKKLSSEEKQRVFTLVKDLQQKGIISQKESKNSLMRMMKNQAFIKAGTTQADFREKIKQMKKGK